MSALSEILATEISEKENKLILNFVEIIIIIHLLQL